MRYLFDACIHEEFGTLGLRMRGKPHFDPVGGMGVAHDILEHFPNDGGEMEDEMQALGAMLLVRGEEYFDLIGNQNSALTNAAADFPYTFNQHMHSDMLRDPGRWRMHRDLADGLAEMGLAIRTAFHDNDQDVPLWVSAGEAERRLLGWVNRGYRRAIRRYKTTRVWLPHFFRTIEKEVDGVLSRADEGDTVAVRVDLARGNVHAEVDYEH